MHIGLSWNIKILHFNAALHSMVDGYSFNLFPFSAQFNRQCSNERILKSVAYIYLSKFSYKQKLHRLFVTMQHWAASGSSDPGIILFLCKIVAIFYNFLLIWSSLRGLSVAYGIGLTICQLTNWLRIATVAVNTFHWSRLSNEQTKTIINRILTTVLFSIYHPLLLQFC